jgi:hypothetical protein
VWEGAEREVGRWGWARDAGGLGSRLVRGFSRLCLTGRWLQGLGRVVVLVRSALGDV